ncbi:MAG: hypothetical protein ACREYE_04175 [Gammaproteobacteria bacterium]
MARQAQAPAPQRAAEPGVIAGAFLTVCKVLGWLVLGLVFSILVEWLGLTFWWSEEGIRHSRRMLEAEARVCAGNGAPESPDPRSGGLCTPHRGWILLLRV